MRVGAVHSAETRAKMSAAWIRRRARMPSFWDYVEAGDCWLWMGQRTTLGYGDWQRNNERHLAHRVAYQELVGPIPDGLTLDHLCRVPACVNPDHLEPVTMRENTLRGFGPSSRNARKTHCSKGHELTPDNIRVVRVNGRACVKCDRLNWRKWYERQRGAQVSA